MVNVQAISVEIPGTIQKPSLKVIKTARLATQAPLRFIQLALTFGCDGCEFTRLAFEIIVVDIYQLAIIPE